MALGAWRPRVRPPFTNNALAGVRAHQFQESRGDKKAGAQHTALGSMYMYVAFTCVGVACKVVLLQVCFIQTTSIQVKWSSRSWNPLTTRVDPCPASHMLPAFPVTRESGYHLMPEPERVLGTSQERVRRIALQQQHMRECIERLSG